MRLRGAVETREGFVCEVEIVSILTLAGDEADIFRPLDRLPDAELHCFNPTSKLLRFANARR
jgi:hypothetical protein